MRNLDQLRANHALNKVGELSRSAINKIPPMILTNGLLATAAFCNAEGGGENRKDMKAAIEIIADHLKDRRLINLENNQGGIIKMMLIELSTKDSLLLQQVTEESLAYLTFLKRFAAKD